MSEVLKAAEKKPIVSNPSIVAARCHEIQTGLGSVEVPEFETIPELGMAVRLSLNLRGLPIVDYQVLKLVANHYLDVPNLAVERIVRLLAEVEFVRLQTTGQTITGVLPTVPYYEDMYSQLGDYALTARPFNEAEELAIYMVNRLSGSPENADALFNASGAERKLFNRGLEIGTSGSYLIKRRSRGRDIILSPTYFSENAEIFADAVAARGADSVRHILTAIGKFQGYPLSMIERASRVGGVDISPDQLNLVKRLAQDGAVKPPSIETTYSGKNHFIFTPSPTGTALSPTKRDVYEKAMGIVAAVRQGQLLPQRYRIRSPQAVLYTLKNNLKLSRATTEATQQYKKLTHLRVARLVDVGGGYSEIHIIDTQENHEALEIAYHLVSDGTFQGMEVDEQARIAMQGDQNYVESLIASSDMRKRETIQLSSEQQEQLDLLFLEGIS